MESNLSPEAIKACCASVYQHDLAGMFLGQSFHPGGLALTRRLGELLDLQPGERVLDVACGPGSSAIFLAQHFRSSVLGVDYSREQIARAQEQARRQGVEELVGFQTADAEELGLPAQSFQAVVSECSFCTFPDKAKAAQEMWRVLRPGGRIGIADISLQQPLPSELQSLAAWVACLGGALSVGGYQQYLSEAGFCSFFVEDHSDALLELMRGVRQKLFLAELAIGLGKLDLGQVKGFLRQAEKVVEEGGAGYFLLTAVKPAG